MADNLVIVESPAKAKTIKKYLGKDFEVLASYGHVRDLVPKEGAVDPDATSRCNTGYSRRTSGTSTPSARALKKAKSLYLATDPDREGEAIAWHLYEILKERRELDGKTVHRVAFYEITRNAIRDAVAQSARAFVRPGQCATGAPRARLSRRLQSVAAAVEESASRPLRRPRAKPRAAHDL